MLTRLILNQSALKPRMLRDPAISLTRVTFLCGQNGSGKSTLLSAFERFVYKDDPWTAETAPVLVEGSMHGTVCFFSMEKDNPRVRRDGGNSMAEVAFRLNSGYMSHGQSNFEVLQDLLLRSKHALVVLDEPESALDLDGLLWLRDALLKTDKQVIVATHSPLLLALHTMPDVSMQSFGPDPEYGARVLRDYTRLLQGLQVKPVKKRLPALEFSNKPAPRPTVRRSARSTTKN